MSKKSKWGYGIAAVYILFALTAIGFVIFSRFHQMDLVTEQYYEEELKYQQQIDRHERTQNLEQGLEWEFQKSAQNVIVKFPQQLAKKGISGSILFFRPSDAKQDLIVPIDISAAGHQIIDASKLSNGLWRLKVFWNVDDQEFYNEEILVIE